MLLRYVILALLDGNELHGYRLKTIFEERIGALWPLNFGQIYQTLKSLRRSGLIEGRFDRGTGHVGRWMYTTTAKGRRALETWLNRSPRRPEPVRDEMIIRLLALDTKDVAEGLAQIEKQKSIYREHLATLSMRQRSHDSNSDKGAVLRVIATDAAACHAEAHVRWLDRCAALLRERRDAELEPAVVVAHDGRRRRPRRHDPVSDTSPRTKIRGQALAQATGD